MEPNNQNDEATGSQSPKPGFVPDEQPVQPEQTIGNQLAQPPADAQPTIVEQTPKPLIPPTIEKSAMNTGVLPTASSNLPQTAEPVTPQQSNKKKIVALVAACLIVLGAVGVLAYMVFTTLGGVKIYDHAEPPVSFGYPKDWEITDSTERDAVFKEPAIDGDEHRSEIQFGAIEVEGETEESFYENIEESIQYLDTEETSVRSSQRTKINEYPAYRVDVDVSASDGGGSVSNTPGRVVGYTVLLDGDTVLTFVLEVHESDTDYIAVFERGVERLSARQE